MLLSRLPPESVHDSAVCRTKGRTWMDKVRSACPEVRWSGHYSLPGPYDAWTVETWSARPYERLLEVLDEVEG